MLTTRRSPRARTGGPRSLTTALVCVLVVAGCGSPAADQVAAGSSAAPPSPPATVPAPDTSTVPASEPAGPEVSTEAATRGPDALPAAASTEPVSSPDFPGGSAGVAYLTRVEIGRHAGFDRVVWEFYGPAPSYRVEYAEGPVAASGSGEEVRVAGNATLALIFSLASGVDLTGEQPVEIYEGPDRLSGTDAGARVVTEVVQTGDFENTLAWAVGVDRQAPFAVTTLAAPTRIVLDIAH